MNVFVIHLLPLKFFVNKNNAGILKKDLRGGAAAPTGFLMPILAVTLFEYFKN
jgi:hypothetical protein